MAPVDWRPREYFARFCGILRGRRATGRSRSSYPGHDRFDRRGQISVILLGEIAVVTTIALPIGAAIGYLLGELIMAEFTNEVYRLSFVVRPDP
jgi:hypothetical protein